MSRRLLTTAALLGMAVEGPTEGDPLLVRCCGDRDCLEFRVVPWYALRTEESAAAFFTERHWTLLEMPGIEGKAAPCCDRCTKVLEGGGHAKKAPAGSSFFYRCPGGQTCPSALGVEWGGFADPRAGRKTAAAGGWFGTQQQMGGVYVYAPACSICIARIKETNDKAIAG